MCGSMCMKIILGLFGVPTGKIYENMKNIDFFEERICLVEYAGGEYVYLDVAVHIHTPAYWGLSASRKRS